MTDVHGLGAWGVYYKQGSGSVAVPDQATERDLMSMAAVLSLKQELIYRGFGDHLALTHYFGSNMAAQVKLYQGTMALEVDGVVGPKTAKSLYRSRAKTTEDARHIPDQLLSKMLQQESLWDPGAQGYNTPDDRGIAQINFFFHPGISRDQAADGAYAIAFLAHELVSGYAAMVDWDGAVAAYNTGTVPAVNWVAAGKPVNDANGVETAQHHYVRMVRAQVI